MNTKIKFNIMDKNHNPLKRSIEIDGYKNNGLTIISFSKLRAFFENNKSDYGVDYSIKFCDSKASYTEKGVVHAFTCITLKDNNGYVNDFIGEITDAEMNNAIAKNHPLSCALNRALSAALIAYFGFGEKTYTDVQLNKEVSTSEIKVPEASASEETEASKELNNSLTNNKNETDEGKETVNEDSAKEDRNNAPEMSDDDSIPFSDQPTTKIQFPEVEKTETQEVVEDAGLNLTTEDTVGFGKYASLTIAELLEKKKAGDNFAVQFISMIKAGKLRANDDRSKKVIEFIKKIA